jgi:hypothetical protein
MSSITAIATVNVTITQAPAPPTLQQTGCIVSVGGTTLPGYPAAGSFQLINNLAEGVSILAKAFPLASIHWSKIAGVGTVTAVTKTPHNYTIGDSEWMIFSVNVPKAYNGVFMTTVVDATTLTYVLAANPGLATTLGAVILWDEDELNSQFTTFFNQPGAPAVNVLELGDMDTADAIVAFQGFLADNPNDPTPTAMSCYGYTVPRLWDVPQFQQVTKAYKSPNAKTYFWLRVGPTNIEMYAGEKAVFALVENPSVAALANNEFSVCAPMARALSMSPSSSSKVPPMSYAPMYNVTPYTLQGNADFLETLAIDNMNWIGTGAQGGLPSNMIVFQGNMADGNPWNFWYSVDWMQINANLAIANEVINGSANTFNPLYYNQDGINRLQARVVQVANQAIAYGLALGQVVDTQLPIAQFETNYDSGLYNGMLVINAEPFAAYSAENPNDYAQGYYAGLTCVYPPLRGFLNILFNLNAVTFA